VRAVLRFPVAFLAPFALAACGPTTPPTSPEGPHDSRQLVTESSEQERPYSEEEKTQSHGKLGGIWVNCYRSFQPDADATAALGHLTSVCGKPTGLGPVTPVRAGEPQAQQDPVERFTFHAKSGRCYRIFTVGAPQVGDLDVAVLDPSGRLAASDVSRDRWPVVPARGPICADREGVYTLEVAVAQGSGSYVLQVWGD
jgi:hypothetical protein